MGDDVIIMQRSTSIHCSDIPAAKACLTPLQSARGTTSLWGRFFCSHLTQKFTITLLRNRVERGGGTYTLSNTCPTVLIRGCVHVEGSDHGGPKRAEFHAVMHHTRGGDPGPPR